MLRTMFNLQKKYLLGILLHKSSRRLKNLGKNFRDAPTTVRRRIRKRFRASRIFSFDNFFRNGTEYFHYFIFR